MKVEIIKGEFENRLTSSVNDFIKEVEENDGIIIDLRFSSSGTLKQLMSVMIIYCKKDEYREVVINKILDV